MITDSRAPPDMVEAEMLQALKDAGCSNHSILMKGQDRFAYIEVTDFEGFKSQMTASPDARRWEAHGRHHGARHPA